MAIFRHDADAELRRYLGEDEDGDVIEEDDDIAKRSDFHAPLDLIGEFDQAIRQDQHDIVDALLEAGFVPSEETLDVACRFGRLDMVIKLLATGHKFDVNQGFRSAVTFSHKHLLKHLLMAGANINFSDEYGETALHNVHTVKICQWLFDMGAVQKANNWENFPIHRTTNQRNPELIRLLLEHGAEQTPNVYGKTPLHIACSSDDIETVRILLEYGGQQTLDQRQTPLHTACLKRNVEMVRLLLQYGGIQMPDVTGATPLDFARHMESEEIIRLLTPM